MGRPSRRRQKKRWLMVDIKPWSIKALKGVKYDNSIMEHKGNK